MGRRGGRNTRDRCVCCVEQNTPDTDDAEPAKVFGDKARYWELHNEVTDKYDEDMMDKLNTGLDNLLIFAGLFSAVDSAFLIVTMGGLSPGPSDETNDLLRFIVLHLSNNTLALSQTSSSSPPFAPAPGIVRQNYFLFASLFSSLISATSAVLAKQWLANYERTGQTGPLDEQGIRRTKKYLGAQRWRLRYVVETLPTLILLSLGLFFVAMVDYVWTINREVAIVITALSGLGTFLYTLMLFAAAIFSDCPFQTAPSSALAYLWRISTRRIPLVLGTVFLLLIQLLATISQILFVLMAGVLRSIMRRPAPPLLDKIRSVWRPYVKLTYPRAVRRLQSPSSQTMITDDDKSVLFAESALSMLTVSPHEEVVLAVAQNVLALDDLDAVQRLARSAGFYILTSSFLTSLHLVRRTGAKADLEDTLRLARAVVHLLGAEPMVRGRPLIASFEGRYLFDVSSPELHVLLSVMWNLVPVIRERADETVGSDSQAGAVARSLLKGSEEDGSISPFTVNAYLHSVIIALQVKKTSTNPACNNLLARTLVDNTFKAIARLLAHEAVPTTGLLLTLAFHALSNGLQVILFPRSSSYLQTRGVEVVRCTGRAWAIRQRADLVEAADTVSWMFAAYFINRTSWSLDEWSLDLFTRCTQHSRLHLWRVHGQVTPRRPLAVARRLGLVHLQPKPCPYGRSHLGILSPVGRLQWRAPGDIPL